MCEMHRLPAVMPQRRPGKETPRCSQKPPDIIGTKATERKHQLSTEGLGPTGRVCFNAVLSLPPLRRTLTTAKPANGKAQEQATRSTINGEIRAYRAHIFQYGSQPFIPPEDTYSLQLASQHRLRHNEYRHQLSTVRFGPTGRTSFSAVLGLLPSRRTTHIHRPHRHSEGY